MSVKYGILATLARRPFYGYELKQELEAELGANWSINYGQIYSTLDRLGKTGLVFRSDVVEVADAPDRKLYSITAGGQEELKRWFLSPISKVDGLRDEFYAKVILSLTSNVSTDDVLQIQRKAELQKLHELTKLKQEADLALELPWLLQLDLAILQTEATLRWLNMCEVRLGKLKAAYEDGPSIKVKVSADRSERGSAEVMESEVADAEEERSRQ